MQEKFTISVCLCLLFLCICGCGGPGAVSPGSPDQESASRRQQLLDEAVRRERDAQHTIPPEPQIELVTPSGWSKTETRALPPEDHGFTVAYEHESVLAVTLYQFTRGLNAIPDDVNSPLLNEEMQQAKNGIEQAVQLGYWQSAKETEFKIVKLGDSKQQALCSKYHLAVDDMVLASDIYIWAKKNTFFKIRCTSRSEDVLSNQAVLDPLLTALGSQTDSAK